MIGIFIQKTDDSSGESPAVADYCPPDFARLPGPVIGGVVFETEVQRNCNTDNADRLPRQGKFDFSDLIENSD